MRLKISTCFFLITFLIAFVSLAHARYHLSSAKEGSTKSSTFKSLKPRLEGKTGVLREKIATAEMRLQRTGKELRETLEEKRHEIREKVSAAHEEFKQRLHEIRDARKKTIIERIDNRLPAVNQKVTDRFGKVLEKLQHILDKINEKGVAAKARGVDTSALDSAIQDAQKAIDNAEDLVVVQAEKEYVVELPADETGVRNAVGSTVSALRGDLHTVHTSVVEAKQKVMHAARELALILGEGVKHKRGDATGGALLQ